MSEDNPEPPTGDEHPSAGVEHKSKHSAVSGKTNKSKGKGHEDAPKSPEDCLPDSPSGEELPPADIDKIIKLMLTILHDCQAKVDDQKIDSHSLVFMLLRIKESLDAYYMDYFRRINSFLVQAERLTGEYYGHMSSALPIYGDYAQVIHAEKTEVIDIGEFGNVNKEELLTLVTMVVENYYATGMFLKSGRMVLKDINSNMPERREIVEKIFTPLPKWMEFQDKVTNQLEQIREQTFKITAYVDFLKQGEMRMAPTLDLTPLNKDLTDSKKEKKDSPDKKNSPDKKTSPGKKDVPDKKSPAGKHDQQDEDNKSNTTSSKSSISN